MTANVSMEAGFATGLGRVLAELSLFRPFWHHQSPIMSSATSQRIVPIIDLAAVYCVSVVMLLLGNTVADFARPEAMSEVDRSRDRCSNHVPGKSTQPSVCVDAQRNFVQSSKFRRVRLCCSEYTKTDPTADPPHEPTSQSRVSPSQTPR